MATKKQAEKGDAPELPEPNIKFTGRDEVLKDKLDAQGQPIVMAAEPPTKINHGEEVIKLPDADAQRAGFFHEQAATIVRLYPEQYKLLKAKGE